VYCCTRPTSYLQSVRKEKNKSQLVRVLIDVLSLVAFTRSQFCFASIHILLVHGNLGASISIRSTPLPLLQQLGIQEEFEAIKSNVKLHLYNEHLNSVFTADFMPHGSI